ncbi:MAG: MaoC family dehydratase N-terminal domain-containing protein [Candidatus Lambdaproteobacteria bacterium]|nr:MaoC family dehydratase N-terminal domain-containing protein [Candidatus Lambdaproteobacteria bacterium]
MAINYERLKARKFPDVEQRYTKRDTMLYALGIGLGQDPMNEAQLEFVYEERLKALPTMSVVLGSPGFWLKQPDTGVDWVKVLHGEQGLVNHKPLPAEATVVGKTHIKEIIDKGKDKGALILQERNVYDQSTGELLATLTSTTFGRGDGGFGGPSGPTPQPHAIPERRPDAVCDLSTLPMAALIYRLSGDYNPLHADPKVAKAAGFKQPILHGLCTFGVAGHAILKTCCGYRPERMQSMQLRFSAPVYPGETIRTEMWNDGNVVSFRSKVVERDIVVLNNGKVQLAG